MCVQVRRLALFALLVLSVTSAAHADKRVALVLGNGAYQKTVQLPNVTHDASTIGAAG
jgi:hypothetical protein